MREVGKRHESDMSLMSAAAVRSGSPSVRAQALRAFTGVGFLKLYQMGVALLISVILARTLGVEGYGAYSFVLSVAALVVLPAYVGLPVFLVREVALYESRNAWSSIRGVSRWSHRIVAAIAVPTTCIIMVVAYWNAEWTASNKWALLFIVSPTMPLLALSNVRRAILQGLRRIISANIPELIARPSVFIVLLLPLWLFEELTALSAIMAQAVAIALAFTLGSWLLKRARPSTYTSISPRSDRPRWRRSLLPFSAIAVVSYLNTDMFIPLLGLFADDQQVAYFRVALSLALLVGLPLTLVESVIHPHVARLYSGSDWHQLKKLVFWSGVAAFLLSVPAVVTLGVFGEEVLGFLYGPSYHQAYWPLFVLAASFTLMNLIGPSMLLLYATEFERDAFFISLFSLVGTIVLSWFLIPRYGALGGAASFSIGKVIRAMCFRIWAQYRLKQIST